MNPPLGQGFCTVFLFLNVCVHSMYIYILLWPFWTIVAASNLIQIQLCLSITWMKIPMNHPNNCQLIIADPCHGSRPDYRPLGSGGVTSLWGPAAERALQIRMHQGWDAINVHPHLVLHSSSYRGTEQSRACHEVLYNC